MLIKDKRVWQGRIHGTVDESERRVYLDPVIQPKEIPIGESGQRASINLVVHTELKRGADGNTYMLVDLRGTTANPAVNGLAFDDYLHRGWYLESVASHITTSTMDVKPIKAPDMSTDKKGTVTTSTEHGLTTSGEVEAKGAKVGIEYSKKVGTTYTADLSGFTTQPPMVLGNVVDVAYTMSSVEATDGTLRNYIDWRDLNIGGWARVHGADGFWKGFGSVFTGEAFESYHLYGLIDHAKRGIEIPTQALFFALGDFDDTITVEAAVGMTLAKLWSTGETKFDSRLHHESTLYWNNVMFDVDMSLKY